jgi:hypothetical protein
VKDLVDQSLGTAFCNLICADLIGEGSCRRVFAHAQCSNLVVKVEQGAKSFANAIEWDTWLHASPELRPWLCPCIDISPRGEVLIMERAETLRASELPQRIPALFTDLKISNWGLFKGRPVCIDYGWQRMNSNARLVKANWG